MSPEVFSIEAGATILKIHTITGWKIPPEAPMVKLLKDQFNLYLRENHTDMTIEEILYAVRNYALKIQDWGKNMNLSLIDQPLAIYRARRAELSAFEERLSKQSQKQIEGKEAPKEANWSMLWSDILIAAQENRIATKIIAVPIYDWLIEKAKLILTAAERTAYYERAREVYRAELLTRYALDQLSLDERNHLIHIKAGTDQGNESTKNIIVNRAKVLAVREFAIKEVQ